MDENMDEDTTVDADQEKNIERLILFFNFHFPVKKFIWKQTSSGPQPTFKRLLSTIQTFWSHFYHCVWPVSISPTVKLTDPLLCVLIFKIISKLEVGGSVFHKE